MALAPTQRDGQRLRRRYGTLRSHLLTFLDHAEVPADNNGSERELRPTATYRKVTGGFRSTWGADLFAAVRSVIGTAARRGMGAYQAIQQTLRGQTAPHPGLAATPGMCLQTAGALGARSYIDGMRQRELMDAQWRRLEPLLPPAKPWTGRLNGGHRRILNGML